MVQLIQSTAQDDRLRTSFSLVREFLRIVLIASLVIGLATAPVAAQSDSAANPICADSSGTLPNMVEGFIQITTGLGLMGVLLVWQADSLMGMFAIRPEDKERIKRHKRSAFRSAATLVVLGPLFTITGAAMNLPVAQCVDLIPF